MNSIAESRRLGSSRSDSSFARNALRWLPFTATAAVAIGLVASGGWSAAADPVVAYRGATIETLDKAGRLEDATIVLRGSKIEAVGKDVKIPETAKIVDANGQTILPGIVDPYHAISLSSSSTTTTRRVVVINGRTFSVPSSRTVSTTFSRVADSFYPYGRDFRPLVRSGITTINLVTTGFGQSAIARNTPDRLDSMLVQPDGSVYAAVTNSSTSLGALRRYLGTSSSTGSSGTTPMTIRLPSGRVVTVRRPGSGSSTTSSSSSSSSSSKTVWNEVREGKRRLIVNTNNAGAILHLLKLLEDHKGVKLAVISTGPNVYQALDELKKRKPLIVLQPTIDQIPESTQRICMPQVVHEAGLPVAFSLSLSRAALTSSQDAPLFRVAMLVKAGLPRAVALAALTTRPAELLGISKTHGSLTAGKTANLIVFDGDPLDPGSQLKAVVVEGDTVYEN